MKIAILGTRGIPATYGGFETFAEELAARLVERGHAVTVYCRSHHTPRRLRFYRGVRLVVLPTIRRKYLETVCHTCLSSLHVLTERYDVALLCNAANALFLPLPRLGKTRVAINVDGLEWKRKKWNWLGKWYCRISERLACVLADALVTDAQVIRAYYREVHGVEGEFIPYGAPVEKAGTTAALSRFGLEPKRYFLYASRMEPENNADRVIEAFEKLDTEFRLAMVGDAPYASDFIRRIRRTRDERIVFSGFVFGGAYRELMSHAYCYIHATEVGGTHPALLEAMGIGNGVLVNDVPENREVAGDAALYFSLNQPEDLLQKMRIALRDPGLLGALAARALERVGLFYTWDNVTEAYETLFRRISQAGRPLEEPGSPGSSRRDQ